MADDPLISTQFNLASAWEVTTDHQGDALALHCGDVSRTWTEFEHRASRLAGALSTVGVVAGDNVALALYNGNEYLEAQFAAFKARAAPCNVNYRYVEAELEYLIDNSDAKAVFFDQRQEVCRGAVPERVREHRHVATFFLRPRLGLGAVARASRMRARRLEAGSSVGSWGTSSPAKALARMR